jgi:hypothetical protein
MLPTFNVPPRFYNALGSDHMGKCRNLRGMVYIARWWCPLCPVLVKIPGSDALRRICLTLPTVVSLYCHGAETSASGGRAGELLQDCGGGRGDLAAHIHVLGQPRLGMSELVGYGTCRQPVPGAEESSCGVCGLTKDLMKAQRGTA